MNLAQALHTAARRYCQEQSQHWYQRATTLRQTRPRQPNYRQQLLDHYGRAEILMIICTELERLNVDALEDREDTCDRILHAGRTAQKTKPRLNMGQTDRFEVAQFKVAPETEVAIAHERSLFCTHIQSLSRAQLQSVLPLPYQRVLSPADSAAIWLSLRQQWQIVGNHWYPLANCELPNITAFQTDPFEAVWPSPRLVDLLSSHGITRLWELREYDTEYEQAVSLFDPVYTGAEGYWSSEPLDWIVHASHEDSITVGGWLLEEIKAQWPDWDQYIW